jgi:hypothetical protein
MSEKFRVDIDSQGLTFYSPGGQMRFQAGDVDVLNENLNFVARMAGWKKMPQGGITFGKFTASFSRNGDITLSCKDPEGSVLFNINEIDTIIEYFKQGVGKAVDFATLRGGPRRGVAPALPDIIIEGR